MALKTSRRLWRPILDGEVRSRALDAIAEIAEALRPGSGSLQATGYVGPSLGRGSAGLAILHWMLSQGLSVPGGRDTVEHHLDDAIDAIAEIETEFSLYGGFTGIAWAVALLQGAGTEDDGEDPNEEIDDTIEQIVSRTPWVFDYDVINGLAGLGVYAVERLPRDSGARILALVIDRLAETAERSSTGMTWRRDPKLHMVSANRVERAESYHDLGVAHGVPGVVAVLGQACAAGVRSEKARSLLDAAVAWLLAQELSDGSGVGFPYTVESGTEPRPARCAWCYGDPGIAASLLVAARCVRNSDWEREAVRIALAAADRPADEGGVIDAGLCHGAAGLGHVFNRIYQATGEPRLLEAARFWFERALDMRRPGEGVAGFPSYRPDLEEGQRWVATPGVLEGAAGVGLALLAAVTSVEPVWDRMLLLSSRLAPMYPVADR